MYTKIQWTQAVTRLTRLTVDGEIKWNLSDRETDEIDTIDRCFYVQWKDKGYFAFSGKSRNYVDYDEFYWQDAYRLEIWRLNHIGGLDLRIASSPDLPSLPNLLRSIEARFAVDENALGDLLGD